MFRKMSFTQKFNFLLELLIKVILTLLHFEKWKQVFAVILPFVAYEAKRKVPVMNSRNLPTRNLKEKVW